MKTTKKLLVVLVAVLVLSSATMVAVFANEPSAGDLSVAGQLMGMIDSATTTADKVAAIEAYDAYMAEHTFDTDNGLNKLNYEIIVENANKAKLKFTEENIQKIKDHAGYQAMVDASNMNVAIAHLSTIEGMFKNYYFDRESDVFKAFAAEYDEALQTVKAEYNDRVAKNYTAAIGEYNYPVKVLYDFEPDEKGNVKELETKNGPGMTVTYEYKEGEGAQGSAGYYNEVLTNRTNDPFSTLTGLSADTYPGFVVEFDYYHTPGASLSLSRGTISINGSNSSTTEWGSFNTTTYTTGHSQYSAKNTKITPEGGVLVENAWNRIAISFTKETGTFCAYANYKFLASYAWTKPGAGVDFVPAQMRFKFGAGHEMRLDNIIVYYGTTPRILDRFDKMSLEERFVFYKDVILDENESFVNRDGAYQWMKEQLFNFWDGADYVYGTSLKVREAVDAFLVFNYDKMQVLDHVKTIHDETADYELRVARYDALTALMDEKNYLAIDNSSGTATRVPNTAIVGNDADFIAGINSYLAADRAAIWNEYLTKNLQTIQALYDGLLAIDNKTLGTIAQRRSQVELIQANISSITADKILAGKEFDDILAGIELAEIKLAFDEAVQSVKNSLNSFAGAPTYESMAKWQARIEAAIVYDGVSIFADLTQLVELEQLKKEYDAMSDKMFDKTRENNSKKIGMVVEMYKKYALEVLNAEIVANTPEGEEPALLTIENLTPDMILDYVKKELAAYEAGTIEKKDTWDYVRTYALICARAQDEGYVEGYAGVADAIAYNASIYEYYHNLQQIEYIAHLDEMFARYEQATTFVDKLGVCTYIENYIVKNAVDTTREDALHIVPRLTEIRASLTGQDGEASEAEKEYALALKENAQLFIAAVEDMVVAKNSGYDALYDAWQVALQYYYSMEINTDEVKAAIAEYALLEQQMLNWKMNSDLFIEIIASFDSETKLQSKDVYDVLAKAYAIKPLANDTYQGMKEALATYNAQYTQYMGYVEAINAEVEQTTDFVFAARKPYVALDAIAQLFEKLFG